MCPKRLIKSTNPNFVGLIRLLKKKSKENKAAIWRIAAEKLSQPKRKRTAVNVGKINKYTKENEEVVVPGKVLGAGMMDHPATVAALDFSDQARAKITGAKGKCLTLSEIVEANPKGANVRIIG
jgi:large subunit ribosomal protein L18e